MSDLFDSYPDIPRPRKPQILENRKIDFGVPDGNQDFDKEVNYLMEMMKFFPDYERKMYAGESNAVIAQDMNQYGQPDKDIYGNLIPAFGDVLRSLDDKGQVRAAGQGQGIEGLQIADDEAVGDFEHVDNFKDDAQPVNPLIDPELWAVVQKSLGNEKGSYFEMMMDGIENKSPEEAYHIMIAMLESRSRIYDTLNKIFGAPGQTTAERQAVFQDWFTKTNGTVGAGKIGFLKFFLDTEQSFTSRILPMFGGTDKFYESTMDKEKVAAFFDQLSSKMTEYIGLPDLNNATDEELSALDPEKAQALLLWNEWLNPQKVAVPTAEQNQDPQSQSWSADVYKTLEKDVNKVVGMDVSANTVTRSQFNKYQKDMQDYDEKIEEKQQEELQEKKLEQKRQAEQKAFQKKLEAQAAERAKENRGDKPVKKTTGSTLKNSVNNLAQRAAQNKAIMQKLADKKNGAPRHVVTKTTQPKIAVQSSTPASVRRPQTFAAAAPQAVASRAGAAVTKSTSVSSRSRSVSASVKSIFRVSSSAGPKTVKRNKWKSKLTVG